MPSLRQPARSCILTVNGGSSSLKYGVFTAAARPERIAAGRIERIGTPQARHEREGRSDGEAVTAATHADAARIVLAWLDAEIGSDAVAAVGHRVVHGGSRYAAPVRVTAAVVDDLRRTSVLDPDHLPAEIALIEAFGTHDATVLQVACFDTAFHRDMPRVATMLAIPRRLEAAGARRYGFHGLSFTHLIEELARVAGPDVARGRVVLAHLGAGSSLAAVRGGACIDTTMGLTPAAGLVMGTRSGDLDPGLPAFLARTEGTTAERFDRLVNHESGLLGVSETSADVRDLLAREATDVRAAEALALYCYQARKWIGAFAAALGGLDALVFAGGIGENAPTIRARICDGLAFLGIVLDSDRNAAAPGPIAADGGTVAVHVIPTDEELVIARAVSRLLAT